MHKLALAGLLSLAFIVPAVAQDAPKPACQTLEDLQKAMDEAGAKIVGNATYDGEMTDELVVVQTDTRIVLIGLRKGCIVTDPIVLDGVAKKVGA